jgi:hypothetical protein
VKNGEKEKRVIIGRLALSIRKRENSNGRALIFLLPVQVFQGKALLFLLLLPVLHGEKVA